MNTQNEQVYRLNQLFFQKKVHKNYNETIGHFKKIIKSFFIFNLSFFAAFFAQVLTFSFLLSSIGSSTRLALLLAGIILTSFVYFVMFFYFQSKKNIEISLIKNNFIFACKKEISLPVGSAEHHLTISLAAQKLCEILTEKELEVLKLPKFLSKISQLLQTYFLKKDLFNFKEALFIAAANEHLIQIKTTPTNLEIHSSLANLYTTLSAFYAHARDFIFSSKISKANIIQKQEACVSCAIEEFKILNDYAPNDHWIHLQLANNYKKLGMIKEQIKEYETIYKLCPNDNSILFKLGVLYFETNKNLKGLRVYEELKMRSFKDADQLLPHYGIFKNHETLTDTI
jgi:tetratricopeptide (TPR) repeat protein